MKQALAAELGVSAENLAYLEHLSEKQQNTLLQQLQAARRLQHEHVNSAAEEAVSHLPMLMRKPLLKILKGRK